MGDHDTEAAIGSGAVEMERGLIALLSIFLFFLPVKLELKLVYAGALAGVAALAMIRSLADKADDPNLAFLTSSLQFSVRFMQLALIGAIASISLLFVELVYEVPPIMLFVTVSFGLYLLLIVIDKLILGGSLDSLNEMIEDLAGDDYLGRLLEGILISQTNELQRALDEGKKPDRNKNIKFMGVFLLLVPIFIVLTSPIWWVLSWLTGSWGLAVMFLLSLMFSRDITRYLYYTYGAAESVDQFKLRILWEFLWTLLVGVLLAVTLGYSLPAVP